MYCDSEPVGIVVEQIARWRDTHLNLFCQSGFKFELIEINIDGPTSQGLAGQDLDIFDDVAMISDVEDEIGLIRVFGVLLILAFESESKIVDGPHLNHNIDRSALSCVPLRRSTHLDHARDAVCDSFENVNLDLDEYSLSQSQRHCPINLDAFNRHRPEYRRLHTDDGDYSFVSTGIVPRVLDPKCGGHGTTWREGCFDLVRYLTGILGRDGHCVVEV